MARRMQSNTARDTPRKNRIRTMSFFTKPRFAAFLLAAPMLAGATGLAVAQMRPPAALASGNFDPAQLPEFKGKVAQYTLTPRGDVDGLILADGTEVHVPPHLSNALVFSIKPGDAVSIRGLKARAVPMVSAVTVTNDASGAVIGGTEPAGRPGEGALMEVSGKIKATLHTPRGDVGGALLEDGTVLRLPPQEAQKRVAALAPGQTIAVKGFGVSSPLGKSIAVLEMGPSADKLTKVEMPRGHHGPRGEHGPDGKMGGMHEGMMGGMGGHPPMKP